MAEAGADVAVVYRRDEESAKETVDEIQAMSRKAAAIRGDAADYESVKEAVNQILFTFGKIDILINNAGITRDKLILRMPRLRQMEGENTKPARTTTAGGK
jgi:3-oxoacyl-[acyl-carrier protein] reductase